MSDRRATAAVAWLAAAYPIALLALSLQQVLAPQRNGLLAIGQIVAPHLFLAALLLAPLTLWRGGQLRGRSRTLSRVALVAVILVGLARFVPGTVSLPPLETPDATRLSVTSWNRQALDGPSAQEVVAVLRGSQAAVIAIQELRPEDAALIMADPTLAERYPHRVLRPHEGTYGMGLLSVYPILEEGWRNVPHTVWARLDTGVGADRGLTVINAHPLPGDIETLSPLPLPIGYDVTTRDAAIGRLRAELVDPLLERGERVLLVGDFNVAVREPAYAELAAGLTDVQAAVGLGPGSTWRPDPLEWLPLGMLRIDHLLAGPGLRPLRIATDCTPVSSDHCIVNAVLEQGL